MQPTKILIIGGGFGGIYTLKNLHKIFHKNKNIEISLISEQNYFLFTPLLHEVASGSINGENIIEPIRKIMKCCLKNFYSGKAEFINLKEKIVKIGDLSVSYDYLILAPGAQTNFFNTIGAEKNCLTLKTIEDANKIKNHCIAQMDKASQEKDEEKIKKILNFVIVGGGPTGVELAAELQELITESFSRYYPPEIIKNASVILMQKNAELIPQFGEKMRKKSLEVLQKKDIQVMLNMTVQEVTPSSILVNNEKSIPTETVIWTAGIKPNLIEFEQNIEKNKDDRILVNEFLQMKNHPEVFVLGDAAAFTDIKTNTLLPALAQVAEKEAKNIAQNINRIIHDQNPQSFFYQSSGTLISLGKWMAIGEIFGRTFSGHIAWWVWRTVYLSKLISFRKKVEVAIDWTMDLFSPRDISRF